MSATTPPSPCSTGCSPWSPNPSARTGQARALIRTGSGPVPDPGYRQPELDRYPLTVDALTVAPGAALPTRQPDSTQALALSGSMGPYVWKTNGRTYPRAAPLTISQGQAGGLRITNRSMMTHPIHRHGHTFQLGPAGGNGPRKDTVPVPPMSGVNVDFAATNPGTRMIHCHNAYHAEAGIMTRLENTT